MQVQIMQVLVLAATTRVFHTPEYDVPCLEALWSGAEKFQGVTATPTGTIDNRDAGSEYLRITREYAGMNVNGEGPAHRMAYPNEASFRRAFEAARFVPERVPPEVERAMRDTQRLGHDEDADTMVDPRAETAVIERRPGTVAAPAPMTEAEQAEAIEALLPIKGIAQARAERLVRVHGVRSLADLIAATADDRAEAILQERGVSEDTLASWAIQAESLLNQ